MYHVVIPFIGTDKLFYSYKKYHLVRVQVHQTRP